MNKTQELFFPFLKIQDMDKKVKINPKESPFLTFYAQLYRRFKGAAKSVKKMEFITFLLELQI